MNVWSIISGITNVFCCVYDRLRKDKKDGANSGVQQENVGGSNNTFVGGNLTNIQISNQIPNDTLDHIIGAVIEDLKYNGPHVGTSQVPFKVADLEQFLRRGAPIISEDDKEKTREYIRRARQCNGDNTGRFKPGIIQLQMSDMVSLVEKYKSKQT